MVMKVLSGSTPLVLYYHPFNRYSFNALAGALDDHPDLENWPIHFARYGEELIYTASRVLESHERIIVGFSVLTAQFEDMKRLVRELRSAHGTRLTLMAGGPHATANARDTLDAGFDIVFGYEAEESFPQVLKRLAAGQDFSDIAGIAFLDHARVVMNARSSPVDIEAFPSFAPKRGMYGPIEITRGCPFACSYCQTSHIFGVQPRHRSIAAITRQAASLNSRGRKIVRLLSPNAFSYGSPDGRKLNPDAIRDLLASLREEVPRPGRIIFGYFPSEVRPEHVTPETLELARSFADNDEIVIGAQSGSRHMLEICRRSHAVEDVLNAVTLARKFGFKVIVDFIVGLPGEGPEDVRETISVLKELSRMRARIHVHPFAPLPQTAFAHNQPGEISPLILDILRQMKRRREIYGDCSV
jgi:B12-binding domain/radical SAM domain protein